MDNVLQIPGQRAVQKPAREIRALEIIQADFHFRTAPAPTAVLLFLPRRNNVLKGHRCPEVGAPN